MDEQLHIVGVGAHPDDIAWGASGVIASYVKQGHRATILNVTYGETVRPPGPEQEEAKRARRKEGIEIASRLGAAVEFLGIPGNTIIPSWEMKALLVNTLRRLQANIILFTVPWDTHADHRNLSWTMRDVMYYVGHPGMAFETPPCRLLSAWMYPIEYPTDELYSPDLLFDISDVIETKQEALRGTRPILGTNAEDDIEVNTAVARFWGIRSGVRYAEALYQTWGSMKLAQLTRDHYRVRQLPLAPA